MGVPPWQYVTLPLSSMNHAELLSVFPRNMKLDSRTATFYQSRPSKWLSGRGAIVPAAHILGGGSSINFMVRTGREHHGKCSIFFSDVHTDVYARVGV
jgi:hypothetical protein